MSVELETLLKEKQDVIASFARSSADPPQYPMSSSLVKSHALSPVVLIPASRSFDNSGGAGYIDDQFIRNDSSSGLGVFEEGFVGAIPTELGNWPDFHSS